MCSLVALCMVLPPQSKKAPGLNPCCWLFFVELTCSAYICVGFIAVRSIGDCKLPLCVSVSVKDMCPTINW